MGGQWIVVANTRDAQIYEVDETAGRLKAVDRLTSSLLDTTAQNDLFDMQLEEPSTPAVGGPGHPHKEQPARRTYANEWAIGELMERISDRLLFGRCQRAYESIVLVGSSEALGRMQGVLDRELSALVTDTVDRPDVVGESARGESEGLRALMAAGFPLTGRRQ